ncbi:HAD family hydrolase [Schumannella luteola]
MIELVLFDLDDTLFAHRGAVEAGILAHRVAHGLLGDDLAEFARWNELEEVHYHRYLTGELDFLEQRRERVRGFVEPHGITIADADADAWFERYLAEYRLAWRLHDDALPALDELGARGIRTGIITNGDIVFQSSKIEGLGLADRFEHVVASGSVGVAKPDARIFHLACDLFGVPPETAAYVGDRLETDAVGAASAGLTGVWLARTPPTDEQRRRAGDAGARVIRLLSELRDVV